MSRFLMIVMGLYCHAAFSIEVKSLKNNKLMKIEIGSSLDSAKKNLGEPSNINKEKVSSVEYDVYEYSKDSKPDGFLTIDKDKKVVGRSVWIDSNMSESDLTKLKSSYFPQSDFEKYIPCMMRGEEQVLIDSKKGIFLAIRDGKAILVGWAESVLTKLRINQFYEKCGKLQPPRK